MDVLLVNPPLDLDRVHADGSVHVDPVKFDQPPIDFPPLGLCYLGAVLEQDGFSVEIVDAWVQRMTVETILDRVRQKRPRIVGVSLLSFTLPSVYRLVGRIRETCPESTVVLGNLYVSNDPSIVGKMDAHFGILGWGEEPLRRLARFLVRREGSVDDIPGLVFDRDGRTIVGEPYLDGDLSALPLPARHLIDGNRYFSPADHRPMANLTMTRGCPFHCEHCHFSSTNVRKCFHRQSRPVEDVVSEFQWLAAKKEVRYISFTDDTFTVDRKGVMELCSSLAGAGNKVPWGCETRASFLDRELLDAMRAAGCKGISIGVETANEEIRKRMQKRVSNEQIREAVHHCGEVGIEAKVNFIFGLPKETEEDIENSIRFALDLRPAYVEFHVALVLPDTPLFDDALRRGLIREDEFDRFMRSEVGFPIFVPEGLTARRLVDVDQQAYRRFYLRPGYVLARAARLESPSDFVRHVKIAFWLVTSALRRSDQGRPDHER